MGLREDLQADIAEAFDDVDGLADAVKPFECVRTSNSGPYGPVTGTYPTITTGYQGRGVFGSFEQSEINGVNILATDYKLSGVLRSELLEVVNGEVTEIRATPQVDDVINGLTVKSVGGDPAEATWTIGLRRT